MPRMPAGQAQRLAMTNKQQLHVRSSKFWQAPVPCCSRRSSAGFTPIPPAPSPTCHKALLLLRQHVLGGVAKLVEQSLHLTAQVSRRLHMMSVSESVAMRTPCCWGPWRWQQLAMLLGCSAARLAASPEGHQAGLVAHRRRLWVDRQHRGRAGAVGGASSQTSLTKQRSHGAKYQAGPKRPCGDIKRAPGLLLLLSPPGCRPCAQPAGARSRPPEQTACSGRTPRPSCQPGLGGGTRKGHGNASLWHGHILTAHAIHCRPPP